MDRQAWFVEQLTPEFDPQRVLFGRRRQWFERFIQRGGTGAQTEPEQRHQNQAVKEGRHLMIPWPEA